MAPKSRRRLHPHSSRGARRRAEERSPRQTGAGLRGCEVHLLSFPARVARGLRPATLRPPSRPARMKRLEYQEETVERFTSYLETLVAERDAADRFAELARQNQMEPPVVDWCAQTWEALKAAGVLPKAKDANGAHFVPPAMPCAGGIGRPVPNVCLRDR